LALIVIPFAIENKITSTPDIIKYSVIPFAGNFHITSIEENRKTANSVLVFSGDFEGERITIRPSALL
jgi:hypothetical protein